MHFNSERVLNGQVVESEFALGDIPGILWIPASAAPDAPAPLIVLGHPGGRQKMYPRLAARAAAAARSGFAAATIELPGSGGRPPLAAVDEARRELRETVVAQRKPTEDVIDRLVLPLVEQAVPEWQITLDALLSLPAIGGPVGYSGGVISIGVRLAAVEPRIAAAGLFAGGVIPQAIFEDARQVRIPLHVLLQWDDEGNDLQAALGLFDAFASHEKTLQANMGGHTGVPRYAGEDAARFFARHLLV
jgi:hypothetical protein